MSVNAQGTYSSLLAIINYTEDTYFHWIELFVCLFVFKEFLHSTACTVEKHCFLLNVLVAFEYH